MRRQRGFTLIEALFSIIWLASLGLTFAGFYVLYHFISKFW